MPWIRFKFGRFGFGLSKSFPPAFMIGWFYIQWLGFEYFQKQNRALYLAENELNKKQNLCGDD